MHYFEGAGCLTLRWHRGLRESFYIDRDTIDEALKGRSSSNIIHLETMLTVDILIAGSDAFAREELARAEASRIEDGELVVASAEDIVIEKLRWLRLGDGVSDRQWRDVLRVLQVAPVEPRPRARRPAGASRRRGAARRSR